jgi:hypothetical protein
MRTQQEAEKAEQQRIKKLVLNYDLHTEDEATEASTNGIYSPLFHLLQANENHARHQQLLRGRRS